MKKYLLCMAFLAALLCSGCKKDNQPEDKTSLLIGEWELVGYNVTTKSITIGSETVSVYISFVELGSGFVLRQTLGQGRIQTFEGTWSLIDNTLSGKYADGTPWGTTYTIDFPDNNTLVMTPAGEAEMVTYRRTQ